MASARSSSTTSLLSAATRALARLVPPLRVAKLILHSVILECGTALKFDKIEATWRDEDVVHHKFDWEVAAEELSNVNFLLS
jgi:hypothetical protein